MYSSTEDRDKEAERERGEAIEQCQTSNNTHRIERDDGHIIFITDNGLLIGYNYVAYKHIILKENGL